MPLVQLVVLVPLDLQEALVLLEELAPQDRLAEMEELVQLEPLALKDAQEPPEVAVSLVLLDHKEILAVLVPLVPLGPAVVLVLLVLVVLMGLREGQVPLDLVVGLGPQVLLEGMDAQEPQEAAVVLVAQDPQDSPDPLDLTEDRDQLAPPDSRVELVVLEALVTVVLLALAAPVVQ